MSDNKDREFKGVWIPRDIWLNENLTLLEKIIYVEIDSLDNENHCTAGNEYFAKFCDCSESKVSKVIKRLQELGMIEVISFDGRHRKIRVVKNAMQSSKKCYAESQKIQANNINNKQNNNKSISKDIDTDFEFGTKKSKTKKPSMYEKCVSEIHNFTGDSILVEMLVKSLQMFLENSRESGTPFYTNHFKGKLNTLRKLSDNSYEQRKIVQQTLDNGWNNFYELKDNNKKNNTHDKLNESGDLYVEHSRKEGRKYGTQF